MAGNESEASLYQVLLDRCLNLEENQAKLREDVDRLLQKRRRRFDGEDEDSKASWTGPDSGFYFAVSPYRTLLDSLGHAVYVYSASSGEITYWSRTAESLYHWDAEEIVGQRMVDVLVAEEYRTSLRNVMKKVCSGQTWCGQFPFQRRSGEQFMTLVAKGPMYEDGELVGIVTLSSDAALFNRMHPPDERKSQHNGRERGSNVEKIQWHLPRPQIADIPQITLSVSNLASKLLSQRHGDDSSNARMNSVGRAEVGTEVTSSKFENSASLADKFLGKLQSKIVGNHGNENDTSVLQNGMNKKLSGTTVIDKSVFPQAPKASNADTCSNLRENVTNFRDNSEDKPNRAESGISDVYGKGTRGVIKERPMATSAGECNQYSGRINQRESPGESESYMISDVIGAKISTLKGDMEDDLIIRPNGDACLGPVGLISSRQNPSMEANNELNAVSSCEIRWEDLQLREEVGQGSFAVVYRGIWNGSDVAVKVYFGGDYKVGTWLDCKNEINIMKKLRHPNVLLFMGAVYSQERFAIVTEFMPRGSLFKILHNANQPLDMKRRLRMALDVVGDFGLSKWKNATFLSTKSGKGTPQWMAPEVLRNEPSNEKSDVFSFGVILWELMTVSVPWDHLNSLQIVGVVGFMDRRLDVPEGLNPRIASIIRDCWHNDPANRPSFEDIIRRMTNLFRKPGSGSGSGKILQEDDD
ncbi:PREDICTED: RGS domain-containing serine/threonine-protein kinase A isoform X2 [Tarenaya hassleriana]|uniref:RGS domain-containing serine/threonine-protein kinase A isoform X2 n=1 Tax=Tarenaya hassleriana TaxID=28532 RepID=UPI00053C5EB3|nr:PREDICTED: RGS domain-containing serine/threonine-protein kinase A isoform X2 [Tarenaya hassleriana]